MKAFLVTGTDTGIGKTYAASLLARALKSIGFRVGVFKPVETGASHVPEDALRLKESAGCCQPLEVVAPYQFKTPAAPLVASQMENRPVVFSVIEEAFQKIASGHDLTIVESAGGLFVPLNSELSCADLALRLQLPVVLVVGLRLGAINHALLTLEGAKNKGLGMLGYVINEFQKDDSPGALSVETVLKEFSDAPFLGKISNGETSLRAGQEIADKIISVALCKLSSP